MAEDNNHGLRPEDLLLARGEVIRELRLDRDGKSQEDLAADSGVPQSRISEAERQKGRQTVATLMRLAEALDVSLETIAYLPVSPNIQPPKIETALLEVLRVLSLYRREDDTFPGDCMTCISESENLPELSCYRTLSEEERSSLWSLLISRRWCTVQDDGRYKLNTNGAPGCRHSVDRLIAQMILQYRMHLIRRDEIFPKGSPFLENREILKRIPARFIERIEALEDITETASIAEFDDTWCSCDLTFFEEDQIGCEMVLNMHYLTRRMAELALTRWSDGEKRNQLLRRYVCSWQREVLDKCIAAKEKRFSVLQMGTWQTAFPLALSLVFNGLLSEEYPVNMLLERQQEAAVSQRAMIASKIFSEQFTNFIQEFFFSTQLKG